MANPQRGEVEFSALEKTWILRLGMNEMIGLCERFSLAEEDMTVIMHKLAGKMDTPKGRRTAMLFALKENHPDITEEDVGRIISDISYPRSGELIIQTLRWAMPEPEKGNGAAERGKADGASVSPGVITS